MGTPAATSASSFRPSRATPASSTSIHPKDDTPGRTIEGSQFRDRHGEFLKARVPVFGISRDSIASHETFKGRVAKEWRGVKVPGHAQEVLDFVKTM